MKKAVLILAVFASALIMANGNKTFVQMPAIFSNNMVLQQKTNAPFWGKAAPGNSVLIKASWGKTAKAKVQNDSLWFTKIQTPKAGGPYEVKITAGDSSFTFTNVMIGEVWLCSGQSNMEMPMEGWPPRDTIFGAQNEIAQGSSFNIRFFTVDRAFADKPAFDCVGKWQAASPEVVAKFSATAFFFGKKLSEEINVPIGLINTSWGGTAVESWMNKKYLGFVDEYKEFVKKIENSKTERKTLYDWLSHFPVIDMNGKDDSTKWQNLNFNDAGCANKNFDDNNWKTMYLPGLWEETEVGNFDGSIWFRKKIELPKSWINKELVIELGPIDDMDITFVNGKLIGSHQANDSWDKERVYTVPKECITDTILSIAIRVVDNQGGGGLYGDKEKITIRLKDGSEKIPLAGDWRYLIVAEYRSGKFFLFGSEGDAYNSRPPIAFDLSSATPTALYNGMIAPLIPFAIKGAIWYQGESNAWKPDLYQTLFTKMIEGWRADWKQGNFPFYFAQIAPFNYGGKTESQRLREQQLFSLSTPNTGMAVTLDIGTPENVHPGNKKDVGNRLALWALAKTYNKKIPFSGPIYKSYKIVADKIIVSFDNAVGGLVIKEHTNGAANFMIAGEDSVFKIAAVKIEGQTLMLSSPAILKPVAARYAWSNTSAGTLFNNMNLPASSFRTDKWKK